MGSDLFSNYTIEKTPFLQGGYLRLWKIYHGTHKVRKQEVCVFVFEKKSLEKYPKQEQGEILLTLKCEAQMLVKFKHPSLLGVVESFVEDKNTLGFVTERFDYSLNSWMMNVKPSKLEIKQMVIELAKAILFLHNDAHVVHNNLNPDVIFIDANNKIKISGLSFSIEDPPLQGGDIDVTKYSPPSAHNINSQNTVLSLPDLSFVAPELIFNNKCFYSSDMFSLGLVIYQILKDHLGDNKTHLFMKLSSNSINAYKNFMNSFDSYLTSKLKFENDDNFLLSKLLQKQHNSRPRVRDIIDTPWFNDPKLKALNFIMNLESNDQKKNVEFLEKLPKIIGMFEKKIIVKRFLPALLKAIKVETLINPCLPAIFSICESPSFKIDFAREIWPKLKDLFKLRSLPAAAIYFLISKVQYIGEHISQTEFSQNFLNLICKAMDCNVPKIQLVVSNNMKFIANNTDSLSFKNQIFPRIMQVVSSTNSKTLKLSMLNNIKDLYTKLDQNLINDKLLTTLDKVRKTDGNNDICMSICDIYLEISKIVSLEGIANKILPNLISMLVSGNITKSNFDKIMSLVSNYLDQIKKNRYNELISDGSMLNVDSLANNKENELNNANNNMNNAKEKEEDNFMDTLLASSKPITATNNNTKGSEDFINDLLGSNSYPSFANSNTNSNPSNNIKSNINNNTKDAFNFVGNNNNNMNNTKSNNTSNDFDFNFGNNNSNTNKKNDIFAGISTNANYNIPTSNNSTNNNNNNLFNNMNVNRNNNNSNKADLLNNLMKDLPSSTGNNNNFMGGGAFGNNNNSFGNNNNFGNNTNSNNPFDLLTNNTNTNNNNNNQGTGIGNTINFDFGLGGSNKNSSNNNNNFMNFTGNNLNTNKNNNNNFGGMNFGTNNMNNNSNNLFDFTSMGNNNSNNNNFNNNNNNNNEFNFF